MLALIAKK
jgi:hypothetical protein